MQESNCNEKIYTAAIINLGCKVNKYEADSMGQKLSDAGVVLVQPDDAADFYIVNTCSVTNIAERKSRQMLRRAKRRNPDAIVVAAGCYVNAAREELSKEDYVDIVVGNNCKKDIVAILRPYMQSGCDSDGYAYRKNIVDEIKGMDGHEVKKEYVDIGGVNEYEEMGELSSSYMDHRRAYIKIQDGCNQFCSYCIIPYTRGRVRSRRPGNIINEIKKLAISGVREFVLTGIHISSYGTDFDDPVDGVGDLGDLIVQISAIDEVRRIRLGSLEPGIITESFLEKISGNIKLCPHFHMSLQSGCNATLRRMNRRYTIEEYSQKCELLRRYYDRPAVTTDIIVGFPGETKEEFDTTVRNLQKLKLYEIHVFKYSVRHGTNAEKLPGQVTEQEKNVRSDILLELTAKQKDEYERSLEGITDEVLVEEKDSAGNTFKGHTKRYVMVKLTNENDIVNEIIPYTYCNF